MLCQHYPSSRIRVGSQPLPMRKRTNLKVSVSPMGFLQNMSRISFGHDFKGKNASPSITLVNCLLSSTTSARDTKRVSRRYRLNVAITRPFDRKVDCLEQQLFNVIALAIVGKFSANNRLEYIQPAPINTITSTSRSICC